MGIDNSGAGVLDRLKWTKLYDPDKIGNNFSELDDYWRQVNNMLHELGHVYGAGMGEYYNLGTIKDTTKESPLLDISILDANDSYWSNNVDFYYDPMLGNILHIGAPIVEKNRPKNRSEILKTVRYSPLTSKIITDSFRGLKETAQLPNMNNITLKVIDSSTGMPIPEASVTIWQIKGISSYESTFLLNATTSIYGDLSFSWDDLGDPIFPTYHGNYQFLRLIKVYKTGYQPKAKYISVFDAEKVKIIQNKDLWAIEVRLDK